jgi:dTDP-4-dehydrorhamnose reductase
MKRLLVTGASGLLGSNVCLAALREWSVFGVGKSRPVITTGAHSVSCDLLDHAAIFRLVDGIRPAAVIHAAAAADPAFCEANPDLSRRVNVDASRALAGACRSIGARLVFVSTDIVFDGQSPPYDEDAVVNPISNYGRQKAEAEQDVLEECPSACVCRLPLMFGTIGAAPGGFIGPMLKAWRESRPIPVFVDEYRTPVSASTAAAGLMIALNSPACGRLHLGGPERISRHDLAMLFAQKMGLPPSLLCPCRQRDVASVPPRPPDVSLCSAKAAAYGFHPSALATQVENCAALIKAGQSS